MKSVDTVRRQWFDKRILVVLATLLIIVLLAITWSSIKKGRSDSYSLLVSQGRSFAEALAQASENAIKSESHYDQLVRTRYRDLVNSFTGLQSSSIDISIMLDFVRRHDLRALYIFDSSSTLLAGVDRRGQSVTPPEFVYSEISLLFAEPEDNFVLLLESENGPELLVHYYLELTNRLDQIVVLKTDAGIYDVALRETGIGYLVQRMAREPGVEYIIYQAPEGIIFSSRRPGQILAIESDPFLQAALLGDSILHRTNDFHGKEVLELVRPFSSNKYPLGLFRVGLSLDKYNIVKQGFDQRMLTLVVSLGFLLLVFLLWLNSRRKGKEINKKYSQIKSYTDHIYEQMKTGVAVVAPDGRVQIANQAFDNILGLEQTEGTLWPKSVAEAHPQLKKLASSDTIKGSKDESELSIDIDGEQRTILVVRSKLSEDGERSPATILVVNDITRLKEFEKTTARRQRLSEMGELAAGVAHEIRNPLNTISIAAQRLVAEFQPSEGKEEFDGFTRKILTETTRLNSIITRFLSLARDRDAKLQEVRLSVFLDQMHELLSDEAKSHGIELECKCEGNPILMADSDKLKQVMLNLFNNSREAFGDSGGKISIAASVEDDTARIVFADDGPGIDTAAAQKIFTPYFTTKESGTGIGLAVVHQIISDLSGTIVAEKSYLGGAAFVMNIPLSSSNN